MIQRSEWRKETDAPRTPLGAFLDRDLVRGLPASWSVFLCAFLYGLGRGAFDLLLPKWAADVLGYVLFLPVLVLFAVLVGPDRRRVREPDPSLVPSQRADVTLSQKGRRTGEDAGVVTVVEGWLHFEGRRTSFALRRVDVEKVARVDGTRKLTLPESQLVEIKPGHSDRAAFLEAFDTWESSRAPDGLSRLPPLAPHRTTSLKPAAALQALSAMIPGLMLGLGLAWLAKPGKTHGEVVLPIVLASAALALLARLAMWAQRRRPA